MYKIVRVVNNSGNSSHNIYDSMIWDTENNVLIQHPFVLKQITNKTTFKHKRIYGQQTTDLLKAIDYLENHYQPITLDQMFTMVVAGNATDKRAIIEKGYQLAKDHPTSHFIVEVGNNPTFLRSALLTYFAQQHFDDQQLAERYLDPHTEKQIVDKLNDLLFQFFNALRRQYCSVLQK